MLVPRLLDMCDRLPVLAGDTPLDTETALLTFIADDIRVGDRVMWTEHDDNGEFLMQSIDGRDDGLVFAYGAVTVQPEGSNGRNTINRKDGRTVRIGREWLMNVPEGK